MLRRLVAGLSDNDDEEEAGKRGRKKENVGRREGKGSEGEEEKTLRKWRRYQRRAKGRERGGRNGGREGGE